MQELTVEQLKEKMESGERFIIDYFATWCGPCKMFRSTNLMWILTLNLQWNKTYAVYQHLNFMKVLQ
jgi:thiol-disulfide isomerase/thioredoxin